MGLRSGNRKAEGCFELFVVVVKCMKGLSGRGEQKDVEKKNISAWRCAAKLLVSLSATLVAD